MSGFLARKSRSPARDASGMIGSNLKKQNFNGEHAMNEYYVYSHNLKGKVIYIGCGAGDRPYVTWGRNRIWNAFFPSGKGCKVKIISTHKDRAEALECEKQWMKKLEPPANLEIIPRPRKDRSGLLPMSLDIPPDLKKALKVRAAILEISLNQLAINILQADIDRKGA